MVQQWSRFDAAQVSLSNANLTATKIGTDGAPTSVFGSELFSSSKFYWELVASGSGFTSSNGGIGIGNASSPTTFFIGYDSNLSASIYFGSGATPGWYINATRVLATPDFTTANFSAADVIPIAWDATNNLIWLRLGSAAGSGGNPQGYWNDNASADPPSGIGGLSTSAITGPMSPAITLNNITPATDTVTAKFSPSSWVATPPTGFGSFDTYIPVWLFRS